MVVRLLVLSFGSSPPRVKTNSKLCFDTLVNFSDRTKCPCLSVIIALNDAIETKSRNPSPSTSPIAPAKCTINSQQSTAVNEHHKTRDFNFLSFVRGFLLQLYRSTNQYAFFSTLESVSRAKQERRAAAAVADDIYMMTRDGRLKPSFLAVQINPSLATLHTIFPTIADNIRKMSKAHGR